MLQEALLKWPILKLLDYSKEFILCMDASNNKIQEYEGEFHPVAYTSKNLTNAEMKYFMLKKECLAIIWSVGKFYLFSAGEKFILQADHKPLSFLSMTCYKDNCLLKCSLSLQRYDFVVKDIGGKEIFYYCIIFFFMRGVCTLHS